MNEILKQFINENIDLINKNTKESWEEIYEKLYFKIKGDFTKVILDAGINDPASKLGYIPEYYLYSCNISEYKIPDNVTSIGSYAFAYCDSLTSIVIPDGVTTIGSYAFHGCSSLTEIVMLDGVTSISDRAFRDCTSLTSIIIPDGVTSIGDRAFIGCSSLKEIHYKGTKKQAITKLKVKNKKWREYSSIEKIICIDGEIIL